MIVPDSNLLLYAYNKSSPYYAHAKHWWERCLSGAEPIGLTYPVIFSFLRIGTSTRAFPKPYTLEEAAAHIVAWLDEPATRILTPGPTHALEVVQLLTTAGSSGGNLVTDAQSAAIAITYRGVVHTADRDFMRFKELKCHYPLSGKTV
jgi:hypothetical protein